jgi:hypothetical protein
MHQLGDEHVAAARHGLDHPLVVVADCAMNVAHALNERIVGHDQPRPDRFLKFLGHHPRTVQRQMCEDVE